MSQNIKEIQNRLDGIQLKSNNNNFRQGSILENILEEDISENKKINWNIICLRCKYGLIILLGILLFLYLICASRCNFDFSEC